jgi:hypothetical protein
MESLPPELISQVVEYIAEIILREDDAPVSLAPYATLLLTVAGRPLLKDASFRISISTPLSDWKSFNG